MGYLNGGSSMGLTNKLITAEQMASIRRTARLQNQADADPFATTDPQDPSMQDPGPAQMSGMFGGMMSPGMQMSENLSNPDQGMGLAKNAGLFLAQGLSPATAPKQQPNDFQNPDGSHDWAHITTALFADISRKHPEWSPKHQSAEVQKALMASGDPGALVQVGKLAKWGEHLSDSEDAKILTPEELAKYPEFANLPKGTLVQKNTKGELSIFDKGDAWSTEVLPITPKDGGPATQEQTFKVSKQPDPETGEFKRVAIGAVRPIANTVLNMTQDILPSAVDSNRKQIEDDLKGFRTRIKATDMAATHADRIITQLEKANGAGLGGIAGTGFHVLGEINGVVSSVRAVVSSLDKEEGAKGLDSFLASKSDYSSFFQKFGITEGKAQANIIAMAYEVAQINKKTNASEGRISKEDFNAALEEIGAKSSDPKIMAAMLKETVGNMFRSLDSDLDYSSLHMRYTAHAKGGDKLGNAEDYNPNALADYGALRQNWKKKGFVPPSKFDPGSQEDSPAPAGKPWPSPAKIKAYADSHFNGDTSKAEAYLEASGYQRPE